MVKVNLAKPTGMSPGSAAAKKPNITIIDVEDIVYFPERDEKGILMTANFQLKAGAKMYEFYSTSSKVSAPFESDGDEDMTSIKQKFEAQHPGNSLEAKEFIQNWLGKNVVIIHGSCQDDFREVIGTPCAPLQLKPTKVDNNDGRYFTFVFEQFAKSGMLPGHYTGEIIVTTPATVADAEAIALAKASGYQYNLPASSTDTDIAFASSDLDHDTTITLLGNGGTTPATLENGGTGIVVILKNGTTWTALSGAALHLKVFKSGATTYLYEVGRN